MIIVKSSHFHNNEFLVRSSLDIPFYKYIAKQWNAHIFALYSIKRNNFQRP